MAVSTPGALDISIATHCDGCIASHARGAALAGATPEQVAETIGVAILMAGGPGTVYGPRALGPSLSSTRRPRTKPRLTHGDTRDTRIHAELDPLSLTGRRGQSPRRPPGMRAGRSA